MSHWPHIGPLSGEAARHRRSGDWDDRLLPSLLAEVVSRNPSGTAIVDGGTRLTYGDLGARVERVASALRHMGVGRGDVVAWQLPNWWEAAVLHHAVLGIGAVSNPLMPILRERELAFMLRQAQPRVLVVPSTFRGFDFAAMARGLVSLVEGIEHLVVVRPDSDEYQDFESLLAGEPGGTAGGGGPGEADDPVLLLYTSGTESDPKGAVHSHNTLGYENRSIRDLYGLTEDDVIFMPSPIGHITGVLYGLHLPVLLGAPVVFQDVWEPGEALRLIAGERCSFQVGATPFLHQLAHHPQLAAHDVDSLRVFACGGADVSPELVRAATERLGCTTVRVYGSTEFPTATGGSERDSLEKRATTDGRVIGGAELRVVTDTDAEGRDREVGEVWVRGPERFLGYLDPAVHARSVEDDGWFRTGDLGRLDADGYLTICGREKDLIIRGGENISCKEIEDLLLEHPTVAEVAIVAMPDPVMVERACAYVVPAAGAEPVLGELVEHLLTHRLAKQKLPERLEVVDELPRTATGKVRKFELRARIRATLEADGERSCAPVSAS